MDLLTYSITTLNITLTLLCIALGVGFYTLFERNTLSYIQIRKGPNKVGILGLPQPLADAANLFSNENMVTNFANNPIFLITPIIAMIIMFLLWILYSSHSGIIVFNLGLLFFLAVSSLNVYVILSSGWSSNSKYSLLGATRGVAQTISYEISISLILISVLVVTTTFNIQDITLNQSIWNLFLISPLAIIWLVSCLAETNRAPFDLAEGESELVSGFNIEYGAGNFAFLFIAEYGSILFISILTSTLFIASIYTNTGLSNAINIILLAYFFLWIRGSYPRIRYDTLILLTWNTFLSVVLFYLGFIIALL